MTGHAWMRGTVAGLTILTILAVRAEAQGPPGQAQATAGKPAAVVNGEPIAVAELEEVLKALPPSPTPLSEVQRRQLRREALTMLIDDLLMRQFLGKNAPKVDPAEVENQIKELAAALQKQGKSLQDYYRESGQNDKQIRANVRSMLQWAGYVKARAMGEAELKKYYDEFKDFFDDTTVRASHIVLRVAPNANATERQAARQKLAALRQEIVAGKIDFAEAAKKYSQCPSAPVGGDLNYLHRKFMVEEPLARTAFALKVGAVSDVVETEFGLHILKVTDRKVGQATEYAKIADRVHDCYVEELRINLMAELRRKAQIEVNLP